LLQIVVSGIPLGILFGLLALAAMVLYRATGVANFAQGMVATAVTFVVYFLAVRDGLPLAAAAGIGLVAAAVFGVALYAVVMRVNDRASTLNLTARTLGLYLLLYSLLNATWSVGGPFRFPALVGGEGLRLSGLTISPTSIVALGAAVALALVLGLYFKYTRTGLHMRGAAERPDIARLLGVNTRLLAAAAWALATVVSLVLGILAAPTELLSADMMDSFLLYGFSAAIMAGWTNLPGGFAIGVLLGVVVNVTTYYAGPDVATGTVFAFVLIVLALRPDGVFSSTAAHERI
jgi:branched-chain amino acid transport system permease protein